MRRELEKNKSTNFVGMQMMLVRQGNAAEKLQVRSYLVLRDSSSPLSIHIHIRRQIHIHEHISIHTYI